ncbi:DinB family protein [Candidatus Acetothermia bacterium]|nr:DinB family protein [Candidatus Acetothermia bacterium]MBI3738162.1 DinB family protein [Chloroflexota bacterium]
MTVDTKLVPSIYEGWYAYQAVMTKAIAPLGSDQLALRAAPGLRSVREMAAHIIGVRARWFYLQFREGGDEFKAFCSWDRPQAKVWSAEEIVKGLEATWIGMQEAIARWTPADWEQTWPGEDDTEPEVITRPWVIWHPIEHDLHHGGEISITLRAHELRALEL